MLIIGILRFGRCGSKAMQGISFGGDGMKGCVFWLTMLFLIAGCTSKPGEPEVKPVEMANQKTHCVGHSLIDLPSDFYLMDGSSGSFLPLESSKMSGRIDVTLLAMNSSENAFAQRLAARKSAILETADESTNHLRVDRGISPTAHLFTVNVIDDSYRSELHVLLGKNILQLRTASYHNANAAGERRLIDFLAAMQTGANALKGGGGYCMGDVLIDGKYRRESSRAHYRSDMAAGVVFGIEYDTFAPDETQSLLQRVDGTDSLSRKLSFKNGVLRKGELQLASMKAQEWLSWVMLGDGAERKKQYAFALETMRPVPSVAQPRILLELDSGKPGRNGEVHANSLSDSEAIALWDFVSRSIRSRLH